MNKKISEILKKLTISILLLVFSFVLLTPTANALNYDPKLRKSVILPNGDTDPWDEFEIYDPPPDDDKFDISLNSVKVGFTMYLFFKLGWDWNSELKNRQLDNTPIKNIYITIPDDCDKDSKQTIRNR